MKSKTLALIGAESRRSFALFALIWTVILAINEAGFHVAANAQAGVADLAFSSLLKREQLLTNFYLLSQAVSDLEDAGLIRCTTILSKDHPELTDYFKHSQCNMGRTSWLTPTVSVHHDLIAGNNEVFNAQYQVLLGPGFALGLWGSRILWTILIFAFWRAVRTRFKHQQEILALESAYAETMMNVATQVSHDITAPVAALDGLLLESDYAQIPSSIRTKIHWEIVRIKDTANDLVGRFKRKNTENEVALERKEIENIHSIAYLIEGSVSEKRLALRGRSDVTIDFQSEPDGYFIFAPVDVSKFHRILSNLLNNAIESLPAHGGKITIELKIKNENIEILITDTGKGIPPDVLAQLGKRGITHDKPGGNGFGYHDAKETLRSWGGDISTRSEVGKGTQVQLVIRRSQAPDWFLEKIYLRPGQRIVILDDDLLIHAIWRTKLAPILSENSHLEVLFFNSGRSFKEWISENTHDKKFTSYLFDYELAEEPETGLDIAKNTNIGSQTMIITGRFDLPSLRKQCIEIGAKLLSKMSLAALPISVVSPRSLHPDAILIEDDIGNQVRWLHAARKFGKKLEVFVSPTLFFDVEWTFNRNTPVYVDVELGEGISGIDVSRRASELGFEEIHLTTAHAKDHFDQAAMPWVKKITSKIPPWL